MTEHSVTLSPERSAPVARLDHLAIALNDRADGLGAFLGTFAGRWLSDADAQAYRMCHIEFPGGIKIELLDPSSDAASFLPRFLTNSGPGPHHITFKVPSLEEFRDRAARLGVELLPGRDLPGWREVFVHPKAAGVGTLLQAVEADDAWLSALSTPIPDGAPPAAGPPAPLLWLGLLNRDIDRADGLLASLFGGQPGEAGTNAEGRWRMRTWEGKCILLLEPWSGTPTDVHLGGRVGCVHHVAFGADPAEVEPALGFRRTDPLTATAYLVVDAQRSWLYTGAEQRSPTDLDHQ